MSGDIPGEGEPTATISADTGDKTALRRRLLSVRRGMTDGARRQAEEALRGWVTTLVARVGKDDAVTVTAYVPARTEPGSIATLDTLVRHHVRVLLPVIDPDRDGPLRWARYRSVADLTTGPFGIRQPTGAVEPTEAARDALWMAIPALAIDPDGVRLGRGGGHYDRTLSALGRVDRIMAVIHDHELIDRLPAEPHDMRVTHLLTPTRGPVRLAGPHPPSGRE